VPSIRPMAVVINKRSFMFHSSVGYKGRGEQLCWGTRCSIFQIRECAELVVAEAGSSDP